MTSALEDLASMQAAHERGVTVHELCPCYGEAVREADYWIEAYKDAVRVML